ncbi:MAG: hypothetical protein AAGB00_02155 [Planctomycetota bacterium]
MQQRITSSPAIVSGALVVIAAAGAVSAAPPIAAGQPVREGQAASPGVGLPTVRAWIKAARPKRYPVRTVDSLAGFTTAEPRARNAYGGAEGYPRLDATGFFRVERLGDRWWLIDPDGNRFLHVAVNSVNRQRGPTFRRVFATRFRGAEDWAQSTIELLTSHGFNGTGCWTNDPLLATATPRPTYTPTLRFMSSFGKKLGVTKQGSGHTSYPDQLIPVFHPDFPAHCREVARKLRGLRDDPYLVGVFSDNELESNKWALDLHLRAAKDSPERREAERWLRRREASPARAGRISNDDRRAYVGHMFDTYYATVRAAIREVDPNHLYLGSRLHGSATSNRYVLAAAGRHLDVIALNVYRVWTPTESVKRWVKWSGKPVIVTEFYAKGADSGMPNLSGAGWTVPTQADRGRFYQHFTLGLLESRGCVGWHYFKYADNDPGDLSTDPSNRDSNKGIVSSGYEPWAELLTSMKALNTRVYDLADYFDRERGDGGRQR